MVATEHMTVEMKVPPECKIWVDLLVVFLWMRTKKEITQPMCSEGATLAIVPEWHNGKEHRGPENITAKKEKNISVQGNIQYLHYKILTKTLLVVDTCSEHQDNIQYTKT